MSFKLIQQISYLSLIHDIYNIVCSFDLNYDKNIFFNTTHFSSVKNFDIILKNLTKNKLDNLKIDDSRIIGELISEAEKISLDGDTNGTVEISPLKSIFSLKSGHDYFFNACEISENILLDTKKSKKDLYFAPSYLITSFIDEFIYLTEKTTDFSVNTLFFMIKKFFWSVSIAHHGEDFSFSVYSHAKMTCAIACALYQYLNEHHNNIFISQNINVIREILQNPTEPRFLFLKLFCGHEKNVENFKSKHFLLWASHIIINRLNLFVPSILSTTDEYSILILPNTNNNLINDIITDLKNFIFTNVSRDIYLSELFFTARRNDICRHFSSSRKISSFIFDDIINAVPKTDTNFLDSNYDYFFTPQQLNETEEKITPQIHKDKRCLSIPIPSKKIAIFDYKEINKLENNNTDFNYFFNTDFTLTQSKQVNCGYLLDNVDSKENNMFPKITIDINISNPEPSVPYYPNISLIDTLFNLTELITQIGIKNILKQSKTTILNSSDNTISFCAEPLSLKKILSSIYDYYKSIIGACGALSIQASIQTRPGEKPEYTKLNIMNTENLVFIFNNFLDWNQVFELFDQAELLINLYKKLDNVKKQSFVDFLRSTVKNKFFNVSHLLNSIEDNDINEYFTNSDNPFLLAKLINLIIEKEHLT